MKLSDPLLRGEVALVGAGPGDAGLMTLAGVSLIRDCDAVVFDALVSDEILALVDPGAERIPAGKRGGRPSAEQKDISDTLIRLAGEGKRVVRLKGGDPFVFGRGGEEVTALAGAGIRFRIIPGITAGVAAPAMAGIPVTDRAVNSTLAFITGHEASDGSRIDWQALVAAFPVLVIYMGTKNLAGIAKKLLAAGMDEKTPVAILHAVCGPEEQQDFGTLKEAAAALLVGESPAIVVIGNVVGRRQPWRCE